MARFLRRRGRRSGAGFLSEAGGHQMARQPGTPADRFRPAGRGLGLSLAGRQDRHADGLSFPAKPWRGLRSEPLCLRPCPGRAFRTRWQRNQLPHDGHLFRGRDQQQFRGGRPRSQSCAPGRLGIHPLLRFRGGPPDPHEGDGGQRLRTHAKPCVPETLRIRGISALRAGGLAGNLRDRHVRRPAGTFWRQLPESV